MKKILSIFGTRPEAIKMAPVVSALSKDCRFAGRTCVTAQHREMLDQVLKLFRINPDYDLDLMSQSQCLSSLLTMAISGVASVLDIEQPDLVLVHGDTTTSLAGALAATYRGIPIGHVEAGLRSNNVYSPWPEEHNRKVIGAVASLHFAPTEHARQNLLTEGVQVDTIMVTGNTVIDALKETVELTRTDATLKTEFSYLVDDRRIILVTAHRRESAHGGFERICTALELLSRRQDVQIVFPVHPNPSVRTIVHSRLSGRTNIHLVEPLDYVRFVALMDRSHIVMTDSGGIQEEAPSLGKPVLVMRDTTERPEGLEVGTVRLVGTQTQSIVSAAEELLDNAVEYGRMARSENPYGDGNATLRIVERVYTYLASSNRMRGVAEDQFTG